MVYKRLTESGSEYITNDNEHDIIVKLDKNRYETPQYDYDSICEKLNRLAELEDKIEQGTLIEFPRVVQRKIPIYDERSIDFDKSTTVWDLEEMKPNGVVVTRFLYESSAYQRLKELQE